MDIWPRDRLSGCLDAYQSSAGLTEFLLSNLSTQTHPGQALRHCLLKRGPQLLSLVAAAEVCPSMVSVFASPTTEGRRVLLGCRDSSARLSSLCSRGTRRPYPGEATAWRASSALSLCSHSRSGGTLAA